MKVFDLVKTTLETIPETRDSDLELIRAVGHWHGLVCVGFDEALSAWRRNGLPSFESITRARRKVQEMYPSLRADGRVSEMRAEREAEYRQSFGNPDL